MLRRKQRSYLLGPLAAKHIPGRRIRKVAAPPPKAPPPKKQAEKKPKKEKAKK